jgi:type IV secretion system protein VirB2
MKAIASIPATAAIRTTSSALFVAAVFTSLLAVPDIAMATDFEDKTCEFLENITGLLNIASIAVVTIAIIFAGYQIAFAHKRIADVAPVLIGGLLIGAAGQLANWIMSDRAAADSCATLASILPSVSKLPFIA